MSKKYAFMVFDVEGNFYGAFNSPELADKHKKKVEAKMKKEGIKFDKYTIWVKSTRIHNHGFSARKVSHFK